MNILIKNGLLIDGTGANGYHANLLIKNEKIEEIGNDIQADDCEVIDASEKVVAPGFIDMHNHADLTILKVNTAEAYLMQGVPTMLVSVCGLGPAPANENVRKSAVETYRTALIQTPQFINQIGINTIVDQLSDQYWDVKIIAIDVYTTALKENPQLIPQSLPKLLELLLDQHWNVKVAAIQAYATALVRIPHSITQAGIDRLLEMSSDANKFVREEALEAYEIALIKTPQFINQSGIKKLLKLLEDREPLVVEAARKVYAKAQQEFPELIPRLQDADT